MTNFPWKTSDIVVDGMRVVYWREGSGEPLLLLHGYPESRFCWRHLVEPLSESATVVAPDWFGWGEAERSMTASYRYDVEVARLEMLIDALGFDAVNLVGQDYGAFLGLGFVEKHPERVRRLALLNSKTYSGFPLVYHLIFGAFSVAARLPILRELLRMMPLHTIHRVALAADLRRGAFDEDLLRTYLEWMTTAEGRRWFVRFYSHYDGRYRPDLDAGLGAIRCPTAVIWGDRDPYCPMGVAEHLAERIPDAVLTRIENGGHFIMEERPAEVLAALRKLLETNFPADAGEFPKRD